MKGNSSTCPEVNLGDQRPTVSPDATTGPRMLDAQQIIAAVHGPAMGTGLSFALASDVRLASTDSMYYTQAWKTVLVRD